jgi:putative transferase (TIGR04331 family)
VRHFPNHQFASENEKGLTAALLGRCHVVVWDQPGTGLLECLTAGIPNLVLWTRLFNSEPVWAKEDFAALERVGIVHRDPDSLLNEVIAFKKDAAGWMGSPERRAVIDRFCHRYARTARDWAQQWKRFIATLPAERKGSA